jgi:hypothetical protein
VTSRKTWTWRTWWLVLLLVGCVLIIPLVITIIAYTYQGLPRIVLEFLIGTWPNQTYNIKPEEFSSSIWLYVSIFLRSVVTFGIPALLGVAITLLTARIEETLERLSRVDIEVVVRHGEAIKPFTTPEQARQNIVDFARRLGATKADIAEALRRLDLLI